MAQPRTKRRQKRAFNTLQEKGFAACALGAVMLTIPIFLGKSPILAAFGSGLRFPGWLSFGIGLALLGWHHMARNKFAGRSASTQQPKAVFQEVQVPRFSAPASPYTTATVTALPEKATQWSPTVFAAIEWRRFEAVCEKLFAQGGFQTKSQSHGADGGVDIWLYSRNAVGPVAVVQCKHWQGKAVGVKELREFFGVMASHKLTRGTYATTSTYTTDARQFAKDNGINALDGNSLLALIAKRTPEQQQELLAAAYQGEYWRPTCASCGVKLVERTPTKGGANFWGCSNYPKCKSRLPMVGALR
jgi:restriction system protein